MNELLNEQLDMQKAIDRHEAAVRANILLVQAWRADGFSGEQIATKLGMPLATLYLLKRRVPELKMAWEYADTRMLDKYLVPQLEDRITNGFRFTEEVEELLVNAHGNPILDEYGEKQYVVTKRISKVAPCNHLLKWYMEKLDPERYGNAKKDISTEVELSEELNDLAE